MNWTTFQSDVWPWVWPSVLLLVWGGVAFVGMRWMRQARGQAKLEDEILRRVFRWLAALVIVLGAAMWVELSPLLPNGSNTTWQAIWPWIWPSFILGVMVGLSVMTTRWFVAGLGKGLAKGVQEVMGKETIRKVAYALMVGALLGSVLIWIWLVPTSIEVTQTMSGRVLPWLMPTFVLIGWIASGLVLSRALVAWLAERASRTRNELDDAIISAIRRPLWLIVIVSGIHLWGGLAPLPETLETYVGLFTKAASVFLIVMFTDAFVQGWLHNRAAHSKILATSGGVLRTAAKVLVYLIGILMVLATVGIDVTPLLASLGVGSLALGLALQKTLEDFLAGLFLAADQPVRVGDYVELLNGQSGTILNIGWRTTRLRTRHDNHVIVPNSQMASSTLVNRSMPRSEVLFEVPVGVDYGSDLAHVTRVTLDVAQHVQKEETVADSGYQPRVVFERFGDSSVDFTVWMRAISWEGHFKLQDAFIRSLHTRYAEENITIPFPIRSLDMRSGPDLAAAEALQSSPAVSDAGDA